VLLPEAKGVEGLDEEIALLRVKLTTALQEHPDNLPLMLRGVEDTEAEFNRLREESTER
jgi:hypothetical protein